MCGTEGWGDVALSGCIGGEDRLGGEDDGIIFEREKGGGTIAWKGGDKIYM